MYQKCNARFGRGVATRTGFRSSEVQHCGSKKVNPIAPVSDSVRNSQVATKTNFLGICVLRARARARFDADTLTHML